MAGEYHIQDAKSLSRIVPGGVDLIISSPPYFDMKDYGPSGQIGFGQNWDQYLDDMRVVFAECADVVRETGSMWLIVGTLKREGQQLLLPFHLAQVAGDAGWKLQETIIWKKDRTLPFSARGEMRNIFEYVLFFVKSDDFKYYPDRVRSFDFKEWWVKYPERYSVSGKAPTDVWEFPIPVQGSWGNQYVRHFCPLPEGLVTRIIDLCSDPGDLVLDPFAGSGAVLAAAYRSERNFVGLDVNPEFKQMFDAYLPTLEKRDFDAEQASTASAVASTIKKLRLLKLPSALLKALRKQSPDVFEAIKAVSVKELDGASGSRHAMWKVEYRIHADEGAIPRATREANELIHRPPLSKYGIEPVLILEPGPLAHRPEYWYYRWDATYRAPTPEPNGAIPVLAAGFSFDADEQSLLSLYR